MSDSPPSSGPVVAVEDFAAARVPTSQLQRTWDISLVRMGLTVSASDLLFGYTIGLNFGFVEAILISLLISAVIAVVSVGMGYIGLRERITFALSSRFAFGRQGSRVPSLLLAIIIALFYGYVLAITVVVFPGAHNPALQIVYCVVLSAIYLTISSIGFAKGLRWMGRVGVPLMVLLVLVADVLTLTNIGGFGALLDARPAQAGAMSLAAIVGAGISKWMAGATITPDITRFARSGSAVWITTIAEFIVGNFGFNLLGLILGIGLKTTDLGAAFGLIGLTALATVAFFVQSVTVEVNEIYAGSLAATNAVGLPRAVTNAAIGVIGVVVAVVALTAGVGASFLAFIGYLGFALPAIPGIILADYYVVRRMSYAGDLDALPDVNWRAIAAFVVTVVLNIVVGVVLEDSFWHVLPLFGGVIYLLFSIPQTRAAWRSPAPARATTAV